MHTSHVPIRRVGRCALGLMLIATMALSLPATAANPSARPAASPSTEPSASPSPALVSLVPFEDATESVSGLVPSGWKDLGNGLRARQATPTDRTLLALQSSPAGVSTVWSALLPQLALEVVPDPTSTRDTPQLRWTLYSIEVTAVSPPVVVDLALAAKDGRTYIALLQSDVAEAAALHDSVFLPLLDALAPLAAAAASPIDVPYTSEEVTFPGGAPGVTLAGTLTRPVLNRLTGAVVLLSGSGPQDRDESLAPTAQIKPFALIADALTRAGVAVLRFDDRGVGKSTGDFSTATVTDMTADGAAAVAYLAGRPDMDPKHIGVLGHSLGGIEVASLGADDPQVAFVIGMAAPAVDGISVLVAQTAAISRTAGASEEAIAAAAKPIKEMYVAARDGDWTAAETVLRQILGLSWDSLSEAQTAGQDRAAWIDAQVGPQLATLKGAEFRSLLASDAGADWARVTVPVLGLYGSKDVQVVAAQNAPALTAALKSAGNDDTTVLTIPGANHLFQAATSGAVAEYGSLPSTFAPDFLAQLVPWVAAHAMTP